jgi:D-serine deaminase-like pyridoxal phosphate-dependent protein
VSTTRPDRVSIDAGTKSFATEIRELPEAKGWEGLTYSRAGDEFGQLAIAKGALGAKLPGLGDRIELIVPHCDPTVNLYDRIYAVRGDRVEAIWPTAARREFRAG